MLRMPWFRAAFLIATTTRLATGCSSSGSPPTRDSSPVDGASQGGVVAGPPDLHCSTEGGLTAQATTLAICNTTGGGVDAGSVAQSTYGDTLDNSEGDDDDCKYHVAWTSSSISENQNITFTVTASKLAENDAPMAGAVPYRVYAEAFLSDVHPARPLKQTATEGPGGTYAIGPVQFDDPGRWTVRFHFYEDCNDGPPDSPHGHVAFYVDVP